MMINYKNTLIILMLITSLFGKEILAQETQSISVIVNDEVISRYDVNQRVRLILVTSGIPPTEENLKRIETQSVKALINERIQLQEASKLEVPESQEEIQLMLDRIARGNQTTSEGIIENITRFLKRLLLDLFTFFVCTIKTNISPTMTSAINI